MIIQTKERLSVHSARIFRPEERHIREAPVARRARKGARWYHTAGLTGNNIREQGTCLDTNVDLQSRI